MPDTVQLIEEVLDLADTTVEAFYDLPDNVLNALISSADGGRFLHIMEELDRKLFNLEGRLTMEAAS